MYVISAGVLFVLFGGLSAIMDFISSFIGYIDNDQNLTSLFICIFPFSFFSAFMCHMTAVTNSLYEKMKEDQNKPTEFVYQTDGAQENNTASLSPTTISNTPQYLDLNV